MPRKLAVIAVTGISLCVICVGAAAVLTVPNWNQKDWDNLNITLNGVHACRPVPGATATEVDLAWTNDDDRVTITLPGEAHYQPGSGDRLSARGDPNLLAHLRIRHHTVELDCQAGISPRNLDVTLPGRAFRSFTVAGSGKLDLHQIDQPSLDLTIAGSGNIKADGKTDRLKAKIAGSGTITASGQTDRVELSIAGSGDAQLAQLVAKTVEINIAGSGDAEVAPVDAADVKIAGSGDVRLVSEPKQLDTKIFGSGRILHGAAKHEKADSDDN